MRQTRRPAGEIAVALLFTFMLGLLFFLQSMDIAIPSQLQVVDGRIISRTPIYSKGHLTSFRFCIDSPRLTFTYSDDEPKFQDAWGAISSTDNVKVVYADHRKRNPTLWGLAVNGNQLTNSAELHMTCPH